MGDILTRKCNACKCGIEVDVKDVRDVIFYKNLYYHKSCFIDLAEKRSGQNNKKAAQVWKDALDSIDELEKETKDHLCLPVVRDNLNAYLLDNYDVVSVPDRFWQVTGDLSLGRYKRKRCRPVSLSQLREAWEWGQERLNKIDVQNKMYNKGPQNDGERILYDLGVLVTKLPQFFAYKEKQKAAENEMRRTVIVHDEVDMSMIGQSTQSRKRDISDISDDIFVE